MSPVDDASADRAAAAGGTLTELAEKLSSLRRHLDRLVADLNAPREENGAIRRGLSAAVGRRGIGNLTSTDGLLRCHECARVGSENAAGWTLRLCGDDELHAFCPNCDHRYFNGGSR